MDFPHEKREVETHGRSPGNGMTPIPISREPLATEGEATPGPDDQNPYDEREFAREMRLSSDPTAGDDPFVFDDVGDEIGSFDLPNADNGRPSFSFDIDLPF
jgi:hypothetical protein